MAKEEGFNKKYTKEEVIEETKNHPKVKIIYDGRFSKKVIRGFEILE